MMKNNIALGFYQELSTAKIVIQELKRKNYCRFGFIHRKKDESIEIQRFFPFWLDPSIINRFKDRVLVNEILIIVQVRQKDVREVLSILRQVKSGHPVSFLLRQDIIENESMDISTEPLTMEQLCEEAAKLAFTLRETYVKKDDGQVLLKRLEQSNRVLQYLRIDVADAEFIEQTLPVSAEWLLDNMYVIEGSIADIKRNLPKKYYRELPKLLKGPLAGFPRIYTIALELVKATAGRLNRENITNFLNSYQTDHPLTIGELWAFPLMLRLRLIEWIQSLAIHIDNRMREGELASFWGNRLLYAVRHDPSRLFAFIEDLSIEQTDPSPHFAEELLDHLFDEESVLLLVKNWLETRFSSPLPDVLHHDQIRETTEQVVFSSSITSLISLSQLSWQDIFESVSQVDVILRDDPIGMYSQMDFSTRNSYREAVERISRYSNLTEEQVARKALSNAQKGVKEFEKHVGFYLVDLGQKLLEQQTGYSPTFLQIIRRWIVNHAAQVYLGGIALVTLMLEWVLIHISMKLAVGVSETLLLSILSFLPFCELSIQAMNLLLTLILPTTMRPRMSYEKGVPKECKTLVVIPMMLMSFDSVDEEIRQLEIRYLANIDPSICFGLFTDFCDASEQQCKDDFELIELAKSRLQELQNKYGKDKFFLFHRQRSWSKSENAWIGWERKRGKLECLNRFLMGESLPENILYMGEAEALKGIRYVITLDEDTQLPKDQARGLIEVLSHPLNRAYLAESGKYIYRGFTIIQPRVATDFSYSKISWFCRIFSEPAAVDPYTQAISNIYQDLVGEGSYHGKGIYDVAMFHRVLSNRFPEEHLLSHDLLEGAFVRVGFASQICLYDFHPKDYLCWIKRKHRWMRGDWQIIDWLFPYTPTSSAQREHNLLSWVNRWKIFDNLRRALLPESLLILFIFGAISSFPNIWFCIPLLVMLTPCISLCLEKVLSISFKELNAFWFNLRTSFLRALITTALLPYEAYVSVDALVRVAYRRKISRKNLLQWATAKRVDQDFVHQHQTFILQLLWLPLFAIGLFIMAAFKNSGGELIILPFCFLWFSAPFLIYLIDKPIKKRLDQNVSEEDKRMLRKVARKTWRYFDDFVGPQTHWLPPDNFQTALKIELANRTSPTNIGMWLFAVMDAYDLKYITCDGFIDKTLATIWELKNLERYEGHFLNWYNIQTLEPLFPRYISTVDSGNLLACLWTLKQGLEEVVSAPLIPPDTLSGVKDACWILLEIKNAPKIDIIHRLFSSQQLNLNVFDETIKNALKNIQELSSEPKDNAQVIYWIKQIEAQLTGWDLLLSRYFSWVAILASISAEDLFLIDPLAPDWKKEALSFNPSLQQLARGEFLPSFAQLTSAAQKENISQAIRGWGKRLSEAMSTSQWLAGEKMGELEELYAEIERFSDEMNLQYLYNPDRKLFSIGYNIENQRLDSSHYDLLASEARIASLVAIAKEDVPLEHWWALGRFYGSLGGRKILLSWGGTMFEYLMPLLFNRQFPDSLLGSACDSVVACQIKYGQMRGIPWGISESAFSAIDSHKIYQYRSFGIPGIGLKRGLEDDLVVSPYSSALALAIDPQSAIKNLKELASHRTLSMMGPYGYYESIDFSRQSSPSGERGVIVYAYMAHHQGMILSAINNLLSNSIMTKRFHNDPRICGVNSLIYERVPSAPPIKISDHRVKPILARLRPFSETPIMGVVDTPQSLTPKVNLLSNENYSLMITNGGGGYSRWRDIDISRWRSDTTTDGWGSFYYIKDRKSGELWSSAYHPTLVRSKEYSVNFKGDKAEFRRKDHQIETITEIVVSPEDNAEVRLITLINHSQEKRELELTSYIELALAPHLTDRMHPCFNKLFIETEAMPELSSLLAFRRLRSPDDSPIWAVHTVAGSQNPSENLQYETDRSRFIGRGGSLKRPLAMEGDLSNTSGTVLDPIFSLRRRVVIEPGRRVQLSFITAITDNRMIALALIEKYKDLSASHRAVELAWAYSQLELRHLRIHQEEVQLFQKLASRILYPHAQLRAVEDRLRNNRLGTSGLWAQGISGDLPIVVVTIGDVYDTDLVKQMLIAHDFWTLRCLKTDLIILNEEETGYMHPLQEQLENLIQAYSHRPQIDTPGGVYLRNSKKLHPDELNLIFSAARAILVAARGSLRQQIVSPMPRMKYPSALTFRQKMKDEPSRPLPFLELPYYNGWGGYTADGRSFVIYLDQNKNTPAPWINVLANPQFGTIVSEAGLGCTWYDNSQTNRLTPWSNDPVINPISDTIYIRDEELGTFWTPTPAPIRELDPYRITHSQGYTRFEHNSHGIDQELLIFVPVDDAGGLPLRIQRLKLSNHSSRRRRLTVTAYSEWVLGGDKEDTQMQVITEWDSESQALFAYNRYNANFGNYVAFSCSLTAPSSYTGDRTEFLGRNRSVSSPEALERKSLSNHTGAALDPCGALQVSIELDPEKEAEVVFIMGYAPHPVVARQLISQCRVEGKINQLFSDTQQWWDKTLGTIQVELPDLATNFLMNRWFLYQNLSCRYWGRSGFYQSSGAYGFRDQLQDVMALVYTLPAIAREHILKAASRQFIEGDVQHWWHPQTGGGIRTRFSDDLLWLPFVTAHYVRVTGDTSILDEKVSFLEGTALLEDQHEAYEIPKISDESGTLLEHCRRAINKGNTKGPHGLPLIGCGDWNDGMNRVGIHGKGESVWLAWFLIHVMNDFADLLSFSHRQEDQGEGFRADAKRLAEIVEATAWDGSWYRRAYFDNGSPLGSKESSEASIDSLAQSWAVISGHGDPTRCATGLNSALEYLVKSKDNLVLLLTPPFDKTIQDPGYIKGYPPGVRENGGQYTHGSLWLAMAFARNKDGNKAVELLKMISPTLHSTAESIAMYRVEPYVVAADIYDLKSQVGRGGWTWYTGSAAWMYRIWLEEVLGFKMRGDRLFIDCRIPKEWEGFKLHYRYRTSNYSIVVSNPHHISSGVTSVKLDDVPQPSNEILLIDDGKNRKVDVVMKPNL